MAKDTQDAHIKVYYHNEYRRFMVPCRAALPNNDLPYFDGSVWKDLRARLELVYPELGQTPYLIFPQSKTCVLPSERPLSHRGLRVLSSSFNARFGSAVNSDLAHAMPG